MKRDVTHIEVCGGLLALTRRCRRRRRRCSDRRPDRRRRHPYRLSYISTYPIGIFRWNNSAFEYTHKQPRHA